MQKRAYLTGVELTDDQWSKIEPLLPRPRQSRKGGQTKAPNRACLEGILWILRTGAPWKDLPKHFPSGSTCWRRMTEWHERDIWVDIWHNFLAQLDAKGRLKWDEVFADGTFSPPKKGASELERPNVAREQKLWWWQMERAYLSGLSLLPQRPMKRN